MNEQDHNKLNGARALHLPQNITVALSTGETAVVSPDGAITVNGRPIRLTQTPPPTQEPVRQPATPSSVKPETESAEHLQAIIDQQNLAIAALKAELAQLKRISKC